VIASFSRGVKETTALATAVTATTTAAVIA
jgi:hypothetical protein